MPRCFVATRQVEHREVQAVEAGQRNELEPVAHATDIALEAGDSLRRQLLRQLKLGEQL